MLNKPLSQTKEKAWLARVTQYGCVITRERYAIHRHHPVGREGKQNKYHIGRIFVLPLHVELHDIAHRDNPHHVHANKRAFVAAYGLQSELFRAMCEDIRKQDGELPFTDEELQAIMATGV